MSFFLCHQKVLLIAPLTYVLLYTCLFSPILQSQVTLIQAPVGYLPTGLFASILDPSPTRH